MIADILFTATAVVLQPITGVAPIHCLGYGFGEHWIVLSIVLYLVTGAFWLPVIWMQARVRNLAAEAVAEGMPLPAQYHLLFRSPSASRRSAPWPSSSG